MSGEARLSVRTQVRSLERELPSRGQGQSRSCQRKGSQVEALVGALLLAPMIKCQKGTSPVSRG